MIFSFCIYNLFILNVGNLFLYEDNTRKDIEEVYNEVSESFSYKKKKVSFLIYDEFKTRFDLLALRYTQGKQYKGFFNHIIMLNTNVLNDKDLLKDVMYHEYIHVLQKETYKEINEKELLNIIDSNNECILEKDFLEYMKKDYTLKYNLLEVIAHMNKSLCYPIIKYHKDNFGWSF